MVATLGDALLAKGLLEAGGFHPSAAQGGGYTIITDQAFYVEVPESEQREAREFLKENGWERQLL